jgi:hypothetical protein
MDETIQRVLKIIVANEQIRKGKPTEKTERKMT